MLSIVALATRRIDDPLPTNVQHLMIRLARYFRVLYIEPAADLCFLLRNPRFLLRLFRRRDSNNLSKLIPIILPFENRFTAIKKINQKLFISQIRWLLKQNPYGPTILWLFSPKDYYLIGYLKEKKLYFHVTDDYSAFPDKSGLGSRWQIRTQENYILKNAKRVFVTSPYLATLKSQWSSKIELIPNVADVKHFEKARSEITTVPPDIACISRPVVGFIGAIDYFKVDFDLIKFCAKRNGDLSFVLIGPIGRGDNTEPNSLPRENNICYLGEKPYSHLPNYLKVFDVCMIPYRLTDYTRACFPLKLYEYLAAGKPVVSTNLPAVNDLSDIVYIGDCREAFNARIKQALSEDSVELISARQTIAKKNSWDQRIHTIYSLILHDCASKN